MPRPRRSGRGHAFALPQKQGLSKRVGLGETEVLQVSVSLSPWLTFAARPARRAFGVLGVLCSAGSYANRHKQHGVVSLSHAIASLKAPISVLVWFSAAAIVARPFPSVFAGRGRGSVAAGALTTGAAPSRYFPMDARRISALLRRLAPLQERAARARQEWLKAKATSDERRRLLTGTSGIWRRNLDEWLRLRRPGGD